MKEREKRKSSLFVKGLEVSSCREFVEDAWKYILGLDEILQLCDIVCNFETYFVSFIKIEEMLSIQVEERLIRTQSKM